MKKIPQKCEPSDLCMVKSLREVGDIQSTPDQIISRATEKVSKSPADPVAGHFRLEREIIQDVR